MRILFIIALFLTACHSDNSSEVPLAKVNGNYLYPSAILGESYSQSDVKNIPKSKIENWIADEVWLSQASEEMGELSNIERKVEAYRRDLYINAYKENFLASKTLNVTDEEIINYFKKNKDKYKNEDNLYKLQYVIIDKKLSNIDEIKDALNNNEESQFLLEYCNTHKDNCLLNPAWVDEIYLTNLSLPNYLWKTKVKADEYFLEDNMLLLYTIKETRNKGELVPLEQVSQEIISILEFQKSKKILDQKQNELILNAQKNNEIEIFK